MKRPKNTPKSEILNHSPLSKIYKGEHLKSLEELA